MSNQDQGGSAFPCLDSTAAGLSLREPGMTLRDYFAAKAMQSLILTSWYDDERTINEIKRPLSDDAYELADAMLNHRKP